MHFKFVNFIHKIPFFFSGWLPSEHTEEPENTAENHICKENLIYGNAKDPREHIRNTLKQLLKV